MRTVVCMALVGVALLAGCHRRQASAIATRALEERLGDGPYRPWRAGRADGSLAAEAELSRRGQFQALAEALVASGRIDAAADALDKAPPSPSVESDRAVIALLRGDDEGALDRLDAVLARAPSSGVALWNRALALRALGLLRGAAAAFDRVAALAEPGWAAEARAQAAALRDKLAARDKEWKQAQAAGRALVTTGAPPPPSVLAHHPTFMRHYLYHAVRAALSAAQVRALAPLAVTLDARDGGNVLATLVAKTAARNLKARAPLAATYGKLALDPKALDAKAADAFVAALRRAHEDDLLLGTLFLLGRDDDDIIRLGRATGDPWYRVLAAERQAAGLIAHDQLVEAESVLATALDECRAHRLGFRCVYTESALTDVYRRERRSDDAQRLGRTALADAWSDAPSRELELYMRLGDAARQRRSFSLMEAYLDEGVRVYDTCATRRWAYEMATVVHLTRLDGPGARAALDRAPRCDQPTTPMRADVVADLARLGLGGAEAAALPADIAAARAHVGPGDRAYFDVVEARYELGHDRAAGEKLLERALAGAAAAPDDPAAKKARGYAELTRAIAAALAGDDSGAIRALADDVGAKAPARCALGVAVDGERGFAVARGPDGRSTLHVDRARTSTALDPAVLVPADVRARLSGCSEVAVFAPPPINGLPELLPADVAWSYRLRAPLPPPVQAPRARRVVVADPTPPPSLALPRLAGWRLPSDTRATIIEGAAATPSRVLAELSDATEIELHVHGVLDIGLSAASVLALSPDADGRFALSARDVEKAHLGASPTVILAACGAAQAAGYWHESWGLPLAFVRAGAAAVFASPAPIDDADAGPFFAAVLARLRDGATPARALRDERMRMLTRSRGQWVRQLLVFE